MTQSLFARVTRYPRSSVIDPHENRLTEVTAAVLERVDGLAHGTVIALLSSAAGTADEAARFTEAECETHKWWKAEATRLHAALGSAQNLVLPRVRVRTQVTTPKGRFVDLELWLRPREPADLAPDVLIWVESKQGSDIHGIQLDVYLDDIKSRSAAHKVVLLLVPRRQQLEATHPREVPRVAWEAVAGTTAELLRFGALDASQTWLLTEFASYLREEGLMAPDALTAAHTIGLMEMDDAEAAIAGICEHAEAWVREHWGKPKDWLQPKGSSTDHAFGSGYWASYRPHAGLSDQKAPTWLSGWFDWGVGYTPDWQYLDPGTVRGAVAFWAGAGFEAKGRPQKVPGNEEWLAQILDEKFFEAWFLGYHRLVQIKYPDELLVATTIEEQGTTLGEWIVAAFEALAAKVPPH